MADAPKTPKAPARSKAELFVDKATKLRADILTKLEELRALAKYNQHTPAHVDAIFQPIADRVTSVEDAFKTAPTADELPKLVVPIPAPETPVADKK